MDNSRQWNSTSATPRASYHLTSTNRLAGRSDFASQSVRVNEFKGQADISAQRRSGLPRNGSGEYPTGLGSWGSRLRPGCPMRPPARTIETPPDGAPR